MITSHDLFFESAEMKITGNKFERLSAASNSVGLLKFYRAVLVLIAAALILPERETRKGEQQIVFPLLAVVIFPLEF